MAFEDVIAHHLETTVGLDFTGEVSYDTELLSLGFVDSFNVLAIVAFVEEEFDVRIDPELITLENLDSVNRLAGLVRRLTAVGER